MAATAITGRAWTACTGDGAGVSLLPAGVAAAIRLGQLAPEAAIATEDERLNLVVDPGVAAVFRRYIDAKRKVKVGAALTACGPLLI